MTVSNQVVQSIFQGNGSTDAFTIGFKFFDNAQIRVVERDETDPLNPVDTIFVLGVDYTLSGGPPVTTVDTTTPPSSTKKLLIIRASTLEQLIDFINTSTFPAESHETGLDRTVLMMQELFNKLNRGMLLKESINVASFPGLALPLNIPTPVAEQVIGFNTALTDLKLFSGADLLNSATLGDLVKNSAVIVNNQVGAVDVTGWALDATKSKSAFYAIEIFRNATANLISNGIVALQRPASTWRIDKVIFTTNDVAGGFPGGVDLSVVETGGIAQVQYTSTNEAGGSNGTLIFKRIDFPL